VRVLIIAEQANPTQVSVPLEGWSHSIALAAITDAHIVTQVRNRQAFLDFGLREGEQFTAIDSERVASPLHKASLVLRGGKGVGWTTAMAVKLPAYLYFERLVWRAFRDRLKAGEFDLVHRVTPLSPTMPSPIAPKLKRIGVPFVMGPLNGGLPWPREFDRERRREKEWLSYLRSAYKLVPGYRSTLGSAGAIIVGSRHTESEIPQRWRAKTTYIAENAVDLARFPRVATGPVGSPIRIVFVGRLVPYKGADMLIEAAAELVRAGRATVEIVGDGPERSRLEGLIQRIDLGAGVRLAGWVPHTELNQRLAGFDIFGFPSVREFGGAVALEAMATGLVPVVADYGGPGELVTPETGVAVPMGSREDLIAGFRRALGDLAAAPERIRPMGQAGRRRVEELFTWQSKARQVVDVWRSARDARETPNGQVD
jgi:starch synthase